MPPFNKTLSKSSLDAGLGLIYRLNTLFNKAEDAAMTGDFDKWNFILDRIFINLSYKDTMDVQYEYDKDGRPIAIKEITQPQGETLIYDKFSSMIKEVKRKQHLAIRKKNRVELNKAKEDHYKTLMKKDAWLRKVMMERGLYLKESEFDPTRAMWGG